MTGERPSAGGTFFVRVYALVLLAVGIALVGGGIRLLTLGGSPYYVLCGIAVAVSGIFLWLRRASGALIYGLMLLVTVSWGIWEAGCDGWALMPRILAPMVLGLVLLIPAVRNRLVRTSPAWSWGRRAGALVIAIVVGIALRTLVPPTIPADPISQAGTTVAAENVTSSGAAADGDWPNFGNDPGGSRFSPLGQITPANVGKLEHAWSYRIGASPAAHGLEATPLKVDKTVYLCSSTNDIIALDAETGKLIWRFDAHAKLAGVGNIVCRGVAYYKAPNITGACAERIITNTVDARLLAVDARTGAPCHDFGSNGEVSLLTGMGDVVPGYYFVTSAPTVVQGKIVLGGWVSDNQYWGEPSGVIRAFDAITGQLAWAWDMGQPDRTGVPPPGESYTRSTSNAWGPMSADESLGLVYVGLGNPTPDYYGAQRRPFDEKYGSSVVALDVTTGRPRWSFQTVHHDLWDYDVSPQPVLVDYATTAGVVHALVQPTKRGEVFILDRATGEPIKPVKELPVPQKGARPEEPLSPTQPFSVGVPSFRGADFVEGDMWGITPLDQLWCRIKFREARYEGTLTPPGLTPAIQRPINYGGMNWGSVAVDQARHIVIVNSINMSLYTRLIPRAEADQRGLKRVAPGNAPVHFVQPDYPQEETPYAVYAGPFVSPLYVPCNKPPHGRIGAFDLVSGKLIWSKPLGTARENGPLGIASHLPFTIGTPNIGGATVTESGLTFIAAAQDRRLRAIDTRTGEELWHADLPSGGQATPMTYVSPDSGRQFVIIASGGGGGTQANTDDYVEAYALPKTNP